MRKISKILSIQKSYFFFMKFHRLAIVQIFLKSMMPFAFITLADKFLIYGLNFSLGIIWREMFRELAQYSSLSFAAPPPMFL